MKRDRLRKQIIIIFVFDGSSYFEKTIKTVVEKDREERTAAFNILVIER